MLVFADGGIFLPTDLGGVDGGGECNRAVNAVLAAGGQRRRRGRVHGRQIFRINGGRKAPAHSAGEKINEKQKGAEHAEAANFLF